MSAFHPAHDAPFPGFGEEYLGLIPAIREEADRLRGIAHRPFWSPMSVNEWKALCDAEDARCDSSYAAYMAFPDKRRREAIAVRLLWHKHCLRLLFFRAYHREAAAQITG